MSDIGWLRRQIENASVQIIKHDVFLGERVDLSKYDDALIWEAATQLRARIKVLHSELRRRKAASV